MATQEHYIFKKFRKTLIKFVGAHSDFDEKSNCKFYFEEGHTYISYERSHEVSKWGVGKAFYFCFFYFSLAHLDNFEPS